MAGLGSHSAEWRSSRQAGLGRVRRSPPLAWFLPGPVVCGGAQRGISLASGFFTGESTRNPLGESLPRKSQDISSLDNHDFGLLDSFAKSTWPNPACQTPSKQRFDPRQGGIRASPDRDFTGPLAATPRQLRTPRVARSRRHRHRPRPMAMGGKGNASDDRRKAIGPMRRLRCGLRLVQQH